LQLMRSDYVVVGRIPHFFTPRFVSNNLPFGPTEDFWRELKTKLIGIPSLD